ncbi:MAG: helix-turn-helix transcriptional regulator [Chitinophagales bacterium]
MNPESSITQVFSARELQILQLIADGLASKEIANCLNISVHTVNNHRKRMLKKSGSMSASHMIRRLYTV